MTQERPEQSTDQDMPKIVADHPIGIEGEKPRLRRRRKMIKASPSLPRPEEFVDEEDGEEEVESTVKRPRSTTLHRKWQREWLKPQFTLSRKEAYDIFFKYLRSAQGKTALMDIVKQGSPGGCKALRHCPCKVS